jgi:acyl-CoA reductase-like NAD-dependent aldehyde dehydrogenase
MSTIISRNPRTGSILREIPKTPIDNLPTVFEKAAQAQKLWSKISVRQRAKKMIHLRDVLCRRVDEIAQLMHEENGKPVIEAITSELVPSLELISFFVKIAPQKLKEFEISFRNPFMNYRKSTILHQPMGTIAVIAPWNYPFFLAFGDLVCALLAGNAVIFKPSEYTSSIAQKIQELFDEAGFPADILQTVYGEGDLGAAIIDQRPAKISFTGSVRTGKAIMKQASEYLIPVSLELGGKDAMIVLPDADLDYATSAALWGGFTNSGQVCASTERLLVHESIAQSFIEMLKGKLSLLSSETDLGVCTMDKQKLVYEEHLQDAKSRNLDFYTGGIMSADRVK